MQFLLMCCFNEADWEALPAAERDRIMREYGEWIQDTEKRGRHVATGKLLPSSAAVTVGHRNGKPMVSDGPFAETKEQLGGYHVLECRDLDEAVAFARRIPTLPAGGRVEVRQLAA
jgi:hypothetical protein